VNNTTAASGAGIFACRSRGTLATPTIVQDNDNLATISFAGSDGVDLALAARISVEVDGTPGSNDMPGRMVFLTTPDGSQTPAEAMKIDSAQNVTVSAGNLVIGTSGKGIDFSATPGTGTSELLADYEEGTWTATLTPLTSGSITLSANTCTYTKVGRLVTVNGQINTSAISSPLGRLRLSTLPFAVASGTSFESVATIRVAGAVAIIAIDALVANAGNFIDIYPAGTSTDTYASNINASTSIVFSATYFA
jgi:hypothetical protein